jgi:hypothetical protein
MDAYDFCCSLFLYICQKCCIFAVTAILPECKNKYNIMTQHIDLGAETVAFVRKRLAETVGEEPQNIQHVEFDMKEVKEQIFLLFYDYQVVRGWPHVAAYTADVLGISEMHVHRMSKKRGKKH